MIDPYSITNFRRTRSQLEEFFIFSICVAGKNAIQTATKVDKFCRNLRPIDQCPLRALSQCNPTVIIGRLRDVRMGQYGRISGALYLSSIHNIDHAHWLHDVTVEQLEAIPGIGPKTARFFVLHSRPDQTYAVLDTHILKWLRTQGIRTPSSTPTGQTYRRLEETFLTIAAKSGKSVAEFDLDIWKAHADSAR